MSTHRATMTRADIATAVGLDYTTIKRAERRLGLHECRVHVGSRTVLYSRRKVVRLHWWRALFGE